MTLILSEITTAWALQVSDRLLTVSDRGAVSAFDRLSNKSVIFHACNGIASLSYTGLAYIQGMPTDAWIAQRLNGAEFPIDPSTDQFMFRAAIRRTTWPQLGLALGQLAEAFSSIAAQITPIQIAVSGWLWYRRKRKRPRPFIARIGQDKSGRYRLSFSPRCHGYYFQQMPLPTGYLTSDERGRLDGRLSSLQLAEAEQELTRTIRMVAARTETVGADCMSISIQHPWCAHPDITARFIPNNAEVPSQPITTPSFAAYSPWVIGPHQCIAPTCMMGGSMSFQVGIYSACFERPPLQDGTGSIPFFTAGRQERKQFNGG